MRPIEKLLKHTESRQAYLHLSERFDDIVPYIGTGLSFFYRGWGHPFKSIISKIKGTKKIMNTNFTSSLSDDEIKRAEEILGSNLELPERTLLQCLESAISNMDKAQKDETHKIGCIVSAEETVDEEQVKNRLWEKIDNLYNNDRFLEIGELLDIISYIVFSKRFNTWFFEAIDCKTKEAIETIEKDIKKINDLTAPADRGGLPQSNWFLPYFGGKSQFVITTNTDVTLNEVYQRVLGTTNSLFSGKNERSIIDEKRKSCKKAHNESERIVYHIHGYQPSDEIDTTDTFVMTWSDYCRAYTKGNEKSSMRILEECFYNEFFLFLGASLVSDQTVAIMKGEAKKQHSINKHIAFFRNGELDYDQIVALQNEMATQVLETPDFPDYSTILCQLVRESRMHEWNVYQEIERKNTDNIDPRWQEELNSFLYPEDRKPYALYQNTAITEEELETYIYPVIKSHIFDDGGRTFKWAVCRIDNDDFEFPIRHKRKNQHLTSEEDNNNVSVDLDSYSAPLGNTIYILGGKNTTPERMKYIENKIRTWAENHSKEYWDTDSNESVAIRVIHISEYGSLSRDVIHERLNQILISNNDEDKRFGDFMNLIKQMEEYKIYSSHALSKNLKCMVRSGNALESIIPLIIAILNGIQLFSVVNDELRRTKNSNSLDESREKQRVKKLQIDMNEEDRRS